MYKVVELAPNFQVVEINTPNISAIISLQGGQLLSWQVAEKSVLWQSNKAVFQAGKAIRGGVPICWPWFGAHPILKSATNHGFARQALWRLTHVESRNHQVLVELNLSSEQVRVADWSYPFNLSQTFLFDKSQLVQTLHMQHQAEQILPISFAFHNYFAVSHYQQVKLQGFEQQNYFCKYTQCQKVFSKPQVTNEMDAVFDSNNVASIVDPIWQRKINVQSKGCTNTVVWNPGQHAANVADIGIEQQANFLCVEPACVKPVMLAPKQEFTASQTIQVEQLG